MYFLVSKNQKIYHEVIGTSKLFFCDQTKTGPFKFKRFKAIFLRKVNDSYQIDTPLSYKNNFNIIVRLGSQNIIL